MNLTSISTNLYGKLSSWFSDRFVWRELDTFKNNRNSTRERSKCISATENQMIQAWRLRFITNPTLNQSITPTERHTIYRLTLCLTHSPVKSIRYVTSICGCETKNYIKTVDDSLPHATTTPFASSSNKHDHSVFIVRITTGPQQVLFRLSCRFIVLGYT